MAPGPVERAVRFQVGPEAGPLRLQVQAVPLYSSRKILQVDKLSQPIGLPAAASGTP
jgi:hypothetical protein